MTGVQRSWLEARRRSICSSSPRHSSAWPTAGSVRCFWSLLGDWHCPSWVSLGYQDMKWISHQEIFFQKVIHCFPFKGSLVSSGKYSHCMWSSYYPGQKKRPLRLCIKSEHCSYHAISRDWRGLPRLRASLHRSAIKLDFSISHDRNSVLILCMIVVAVLFLARVVLASPFLSQCAFPTGWAPLCWKDHFFRSVLFSFCDNP